MQWWGVRDRKALSDTVVEHIDVVADAARSGRWDRLADLIDTGPGSMALPAEAINAVRIGGLSGYSPLHQVAWHGAPVEIAQHLLRHGAWRTLRCSLGNTPRHIAEARGHEHLAPVLTPEPIHAVSQPVLEQLEHILHALIVGRVHDFGVDTRLLRLPQLGPLTEIHEPAMWMSVPGMYGGFSISLTGSDTEAELTVESWCRVVGGSGERHRVCTTGFELVERGFV